MNHFAARLGRYLRRNHLGLIAIFLALNGVAYAAVSKGTVDSESVRDRSLQGVDIQSSAIHARNINVKSVSSVLQARVKGICKSGEAIRVITRRGAVSCTSLTVEAKDLDVSSVSGVLQQRVKGRCKTGEAISSIRSTGEVICVATADGGEKITGIATGGGLTGGGSNGNLTISTDPTALQRRVSGTCAGNQAVRSVGEEGTVGCNPFQVPLSNGGCTAADNAISGIDATTGAVTCVPAVGSVTAGAGLSGGGGPGAVSLAADTSYLQRRVTPGCAGSTAIQTVNADGTVTCLNTGTGSVTSVGVAAGSGLTASPSPITTTGTLGTDFTTIQKRVTGACAAAGATGIQSVAADGTVTCGNLQIRVTGTCATAGSNAIQTVNADGTVTCGNLQQRVTGTCAGNNAIQSVAADGTVTCRSVVTSVGAAAGSGITVSPDPITGTGTVGTDFTTIQKRVGGSCAGDTAVQSVAADGTVNCSAAFAPAAKVLTSGLQEQSHGGADVVLLKNAYFEILGRCPAGEGVKIIARANTGMNSLVDSQVNGFHAVGTVAEDTLSSVTTNNADMAKYELGGTTGLAAGRTLSGGFYDFATSAGCQFAATGIAG